MTKSGKHCGQRRNCSFWAISCFVTMISKSRLLQRRQKASIWGKGFTFYQIRLLWNWLWKICKNLFKRYIVIHNWKQFWKRRNDWSWAIFSCFHTVSLSFSYIRHKLGLSVTRWKWIRPISPRQILCITSDVDKILSTSLV